MIDRIIDIINIILIAIGIIAIVIVYIDTFKNGDKNEWAWI